jgi:cytochrome c-type biogenesis protein CcmE
MRSYRLVHLPRRRTVLLATFLATLSACIYLPFGFTPIKDIVANPTHYENKEVKVTGTVSNVTKIPFVQMKFYVLSDGSSEIPVVTNGLLPSLNSKVTVLGVVQNVAIIGNESLGLHIRETKRVEHSQ